MKSRTLPPIESPDVPYTSLKKAREAEAELKFPQYKTSLTPPSWPAESMRVSDEERKVGRVERALEDLARREQILAVQVKAHRRCEAELAEERALLEAERLNHAQKMKAAEDSLNQMREQLALEKQSLEALARSSNAGLEEGQGEVQKSAPSEKDPTRPEDRTVPTGSGSVECMSPEAGQLFSRLAKEAADFAALTASVTEMQRQFTEERARHETVVEGRMNELREKEEALSQRDAEVSARIDAATRQLASDRENLAHAQGELAAAKSALAEEKLRLEAAEKDLAEREKAHASNVEKLREDDTRVAARLNAIASVEEGHRERENELRRLEQRVRDQGAELARRQAELAAAEADVRNAGSEAVAMQGAVERQNAELSAGWEKLRSETEALAAARKEQAEIGAALDARERDIEHKRLAFDERRRKLCETLSSFAGE